jgi:hypothetical protein
MNRLCLPLAPLTIARVCGGVAVIFWLASPEEAVVRMMRGGDGGCLPIVSSRSLLYEILCFFARALPTGFAQQLVELGIK